MSTTRLVPALLETPGTQMHLMGKNVNFAHVPFNRRNINLLLNTACFKMDVTGKQPYETQSFTNKSQNVVSK